MVYYTQSLSKAAYVFFKVPAATYSTQLNTELNAKIAKTIQLFNFALKNVRFTVTLT